MIWALLALLGIPLWFIAVILVAVVRNRRHVRSSPQVFSYIERTDKGWARRRGYARWVSDVMIIHRGPALVRSDVHQVTGSVTKGPPDEQPRKLLDAAVELEFTFADRPPLRVAVDQHAVETALGGSNTTE